MKIIAIALGLCEVASMAMLFTILLESSWSISIQGLLFALACYALIVKKDVLKIPRFSVKYGVLFFVLILLNISFIWAVKMFPLDDAALVFTTLQAPLEGFSNIFVKKYITDVLLTSIILALFLTFAVQRVSSFKIKTAVLLLFCLFLAGWALGTVYSVIVSDGYKKQLLEHYNDDGKWAHSDFFSKNYVFVDSIVNSNDSIQPRNLIFIIMESMETSFMDVLQKGNLITELTQVRGGEYNFSNSVGFGGGQDVEGSTNTITAIMAKTMACPFLFRFGMSYSLFTLTGIKSIYELLSKHGYYNVFIQGTDAKFSGKERLFRLHGIDDVYASEKLTKFQDFTGNDDDQEFDIGITDRALIEISKGVLDTLSRKEHFTFTLLTVETLFPYGFYNPACEDKPIDSSEESKFEAAIRCASKDMRKFIEWIKEQPYYENTEIVVVGDHLFPGEYLVDKNDSTRRWIDLFINPAIQPKKLKKREFTSFDIAPSILESMGFDVDGHRMGFGVSLFSEEATLLEKYGLNELNDGMLQVKKSTEYKNLNGI